MTQHKLTEEYFRDLRRETLWKGIPLVLLLVSVPLLAIPGAAANIFSIIPVLVLAVTVLIATSHTMKRREAILGSLVLELRDRSLFRHVDGAEDIEISFSEITKVLTSRRALIVVGSSSRRVISIPRTVSDFELLETRITSASEVHPRRVYDANFPAIVLMLVAMIVTFGSSNPTFVVPSGLALVLGLLACSYLILTDKHGERAFRRFGWLSLLPILVVCYRVWSVLHLGTGAR